MVSAAFLTLLGCESRPSPERGRIDVEKDHVAVAPVAASATPSHSSATPRGRRAPQPCRPGDEPPTSRDAEQRAIRQAATLGGQPKPTLVPYTPPRLPSGFGRNDGGLPSWLDAERTHANRHRAYQAAFEDAPHRNVYVDVHVHTKVAPGEPKQWADAVLERHNQLGYDLTGREIREDVAVFATAWRDRLARLNLEYVWIPKGCDRFEIYVRFIQDRANLLEVRLEIHGTAKPARAAPWLHAFFDAPFGSAPPKARRFAAGHEHNL